MGAGVLGALVADLPDVVRVTQELEERGTPHRPGRALRGRDCRQSAGGGFGQKAGDGVLAFGVGVEDPADEGRAIRIDLNRAVLPTLRVALVDVQVADRRPAQGAAVSDFLGDAFGDFGGEVARVELRNRGHDPVQQHPGRGLVDVLRRGHEHHPALLECEVDAHVVGTVPGEPVDLVNDAVRDLVGLDVLDHQHQFGPVGRLG
nr:hypothetical protein [Austwickia sp. TVS 96-490-7B]